MARLGSSFCSPSPGFGRSTCKLESSHLFYQYDKSCFFLQGSLSIVELKFLFCLCDSCVKAKPDCFCLAGFQLGQLRIHFPLQNTQARFATDSVRSKGRLHKQEFNSHRPALYGLVYFSLRHIRQKESLHCRNLAYNIIKLCNKIIGVFFPPEGMVSNPAI